MGSLRQILIGFAACVITLGPLALACSGGLSPHARCKLEALRVLPKERRMVTPYDALDLYDRVAACDHAGADGGP